MQTSGFQPKKWCKSTDPPVIPGPVESAKVATLQPTRTQLHINDIRESSLLAITQCRHSAVGKMPQGFQPARSALPWPSPAPSLVTLPIKPEIPVVFTQQLPPVSLPRPQPQPQPQPQVQAPPMATQTLWAEKHRPQQLRHFFGNPKAVEKLVKWVTARKRNPGTSHNPNVVALLSGPPGIGKTTIANLVLRNLGFKVVEINASDIRTRRAVYDLVKETVTRKPLRNPCAIILDELDGAVSHVGNTSDDPSEEDDNSGVAGVWQFVQECKKHQWPVAYPIICISNDVASKPMRQLMTATENIKFFPPFEKVVQEVLKSICNKEGIRLNAVQQKHVVEAARGDLRRLCQLLQMMSIRPMTLNTQVVDMLQNSKSDGAVDDLFPSVRRLMYQKATSVEDGQKLVEKDAAIITVMVHENLPAMAQHDPTMDTPKSLDQLALAYDDLSLIDILDTVDWQARGCDDNVSAALLSGMVRTRCQSYRQAALKKGGDQHVEWTQYFDQRKMQSSQAQVVQAATYAWHVPVTDLGLVNFLNSAPPRSFPELEIQPATRMEIDPDLQDLANQWQWITKTTPKTTPKKKAYRS
jgi:hypothetical protein